MADDAERLREEKERKKAEVRKRMEEAAKATQKKKGFMTPQRKKKLRTLLRKKAAEELKKEQERKANERKRIIAERCGTAKALEGINEATLQAICKEYYGRINKLEDAKYDLECEVRQKDFVISELSAKVNDLRGKFVKPPLKKVKFDSKFDKLSKLVAKAEMDFRANLKVVKVKKFTLDEDEKTAKKAAPEWANK